MHLILINFIIVLRQSVWVFCVLRHGYEEGEDAASELKLQVTKEK